MRFLQEQFRQDNRIYRINYFSHRDHRASPVFGSKTGEIVLSLAAL
jgi:hypothetical protein